MNPERPWCHGQSSSISLVLPPFTLQLGILHPLPAPQTRAPPSPPTSRDEPAPCCCRTSKAPATISTTHPPEYTCPLIAGVSRRPQGQSPCLQPLVLPLPPGSSSESFTRADESTNLLQLPGRPMRDLLPTRLLGDLIQSRRNPT